jgi:hypothetical protein
MSQHTQSLSPLHTWEWLVGRVYIEPQPWKIHWKEVDFSMSHRTASVHHLCTQDRVRRPSTLASRYCSGIFLCYTPKSDACHVSWSLGLSIVNLWASRVHYINRIGCCSHALYAFNLLFKFVLASNRPVHRVTAQFLYSSCFSAWAFSCLVSWTIALGLVKKPVTWTRYTQTQNTQNLNFVREFRVATCKTWICFGQFRYHNRVPEIPELPELSCVMYSCHS